MIELDKLRMPNVSRECMDVLRLLESDDVDAQTLVKAITLDPVLSGTLLRYANSPAHRRARDATSVQQAINVLGLRQVRAAAVVATMRGFCNQDALSSTLWEQGLTVSTLARAIAEPRFGALADELELLGLLHNLGGLVLISNYPALYTTLVEGIRLDGIPVHDAEREVFGVDRGDLTPLLAARFHLPQRVVQVLTAYHARQVPKDIDSDTSRALACLWLAQVAGRRSLTASDWLPEWLPANVPALLQLLDIGEEEFLNLTEDCEALVAQRLAA